MTSKNNPPEKAAELRRRAEEIDQREAVMVPENPESLSFEEIRQTYHELRVHQIELEMQNDELRRTQVELGAIQARYFDLYNLAPVGYCTISEKGLILEANLTAATLLDVARGELAGKPITRFIFKADQDIYYLHRKQLLETCIPKVFELRMVKKDQTIFWVRLNITLPYDSADTPEYWITLTDITERKLKELALRESEERFRKLFDNHSAVKLILDAETGNINDANRAAAQFYGWPVEQLKQMRIQEINTLPSEIVKAKIEEVGQAKGVSSEFRHRRADGSIRDVEVFSNRIEIAGKNLLYSIIHDITERKWAEEALREEEHYLHTILQTTIDGFWVVDLKGKIIRVNEAYCRMSGYTCAELLKLDLFALEALEKPAETFVRIQRIIGSGSEIFETRHRRKDGSVFDVEISTTYMKAGGKFVSFCRDITERKQTEELLQKNQEEIQIMMDSSPIMIFYKDCEDRFIRINKTLADLTGLPKEAMEGKTTSEIYPCQDNNYWEDDKEVIASGKSKIGIIEPIILAAGLRWVQTDKVPYKYKDGSVVGIIGFAVDITERKQAEEQLRAINNDLERRVEERTRELQEAQSQYLHAEKLSAIGKLSASIAHEFNNPLQGIMSILKGLKKRAILEEEDRDLLDGAISESERMKNLIRSLQDFNRPSSGKKVVVDVQASIESLLLMCKNDFKSKKISTDLNYAERLPQIVAVPDQIKQVFLNLLTNAADACLERGGVITISTWQEGKRVAVEIKDTGIGIESEKMDLIFQPFYTTKPTIKGTGLGLSVCHGIVKNHQGEIRVESQPGKGSTFTVLLPIKGE